MSRNTLHYFMRRAEAETEAASRAADERTRQLHEELAALLRQRAAEPAHAAEAAA